MNAATSGFWKNRRVLVTGYEGFLGSWLTRKLLEQGSRVYGIDTTTRRPKTVLTRADRSRIKITRGSVENYRLLSGLIDENKIQTVFHLAAKAIVGECLIYPAKAFSVNIKGTWNLLEACRRGKNVAEVIVASSDKAYGQKKFLPYREDDPLNGIHPYDVSKSCADLITKTYFHTYELPVCVTRSGNIYGPGDYHFSRLVPDAVCSALQGKTLVIRSNGKFIRDYIYIEDIVDGYITLAEKMTSRKLAGEAFNFSAGKPVSVLELVSLVYRLAGRKPAYRILNQADKEIPDQYLSSQKAGTLLNWKNRLKLEDGLKRTIAWYKNCGPAS